MNIRLAIRSITSRINRLLPSSLHRFLLKQYLLDQDVTLRHGYLCCKHGYGSPVTVATEINVSALGQKRHLPGIEIHHDDITQLGSELSKHAADFPWTDGRASPAAPWGIMFPTLDSLVLHTMIRHFKPRQYIEVGCGFSSRVSSKALELNRRDGLDSKATFIEPYPGDRLLLDELLGNFIEKKIQDVPLDLYRTLEPGDMLFIDTSHVMKCQSDVEWEFLHVLPELPKGVIIHIHDIYTPYDYPLEWLENNYSPGMYNEQYALEALLSGGGRFRVLFPVHMLCREMPVPLLEWFGVSADSSRSFWIVVD